MYHFNPASSFTPPDPNSYYPPTSLDFNPQKAKELLREAGYEDVCTRRDLGQRERVTGGRRP